MKGQILAHWKSGIYSKTEVNNQGLLAKLNLNLTYSCRIPIKTRHYYIEGKKDSDTVKNEGQINSVSFVLWHLLFLQGCLREMQSIEIIARS